MQRPRILIVDDESSIRIALFRSLEKRNFQIITASSLTEAETLSSAEQGIDIALIDLRLPDGDGLEFMTKLTRQHQHCQTLIQTGYGTIQGAIEATRRGAFHYITKPFNI